MKMPKILRVYHEGDKCNPEFASRRQLFLDVDPYLRMVMYLGDVNSSCYFVGTENIQDNKRSKSNGFSKAINQERDAFIKKYESLSSDEISASLMVTFDEVVSTLNQEVSCVGCRRSVEELVGKLPRTGGSALEPLVITGDRVVSISRDYALSPHSLANLLCLQLEKLHTMSLDSSSLAGKAKKSSVRCPSHTVGLSAKRSIFASSWQDIWDCIDPESQDEVVTVQFENLRETIDRYLKKHSFCTECANMVNKAYSILIKPESAKQGKVCEGKYVPPEKEEETIKDACNHFRGISVCQSEKHIHVNSSPSYLTKLIIMAEPEIHDMRQERHAKTIEVAKKEVLTCVGICLYERFRKLQHKYRVGQQACDILFVMALKALKNSYDKAVERKQGMSELERICKEFDEEDKRKLEKAQRKRDLKKIKLKKKKEESLEEKSILKNGNLAKTESIVRTTNDNSSQQSAEVILKKAQKSSKPLTSPNSNNNNNIINNNNVNNNESRRTQQSNLTSSKKGNFANDDSKIIQPKAVEKPSTQKIIGQNSAPVFRRLTRKPCPNQEPFSILSLERMLNGIDNKGSEDEDEGGIPLEEIQDFHARLSDVEQQREELRKNLRIRFAQFCGNGL